MPDNTISVTDIIAGYEDPIRGWDSMQVKECMLDEYGRWLSGLCRWRSFWTLTFKDEKSNDVAKSLFNWILRVLNTDLLGKNYVNRVGHCYFSYVVALENQKREVPHFHVLADMPINYTLLHSTWGARCGFAWIDGKIRGQDTVSRYVSKYILKDGNIDVYMRKREFYPPRAVPEWFEKGML